MIHLPKIESEYLKARLDELHFIPQTEKKLYLCRVFKKHLGITPIDYINNLRFGYAESLILKTDLEIMDICMEIGIENLGYFYKEFKKRFHSAPMAYRKKHATYPRSWI